MKPIDENLKAPKKAKKVKKEYLIIAVLVAVVFAIFLSGSSVLSSFSKDKGASEDYASQIENRLENLLSQVDGVGKVKVFVSTDGSASDVVLKEVEEELVDGVKNTIESVIMVGGKPYITKTENPKIVGIAVVCQGADNLSVKVTLTEIITTTLSVDAECVRIIKMK